jgi:hypothetical protein
MLTRDAVQKRVELQDEPEIKRLVQQWWDGIMYRRRRRLTGPLRKGVHKRMTHRMHKDSYALLNIALHRYFKPDVTPEEAIDAAERDW